MQSRGTLVLTMIDLYELPIPDWGLTCPSCETPLAGLEQHQCPNCSRGLDMLSIVANCRPIPDLGIGCPECEYALTGLSGNRCPECGQQFSLRKILEEEASVGGIQLHLFMDPPDHHLKRREPRFTGSERPLPDFGLQCWKCAHALAGATADECPSCGATFNIAELLPVDDWILIGQFVPAQLSAVAKQILYEDQIPYVMENAALGRVYGNLSPMFTGDLRIPREFLLDALYALTEALNTEAQPSPPWICPECGEKVPSGFDLCWKCMSPRPGLEEPRDTPDA